MRRNSRSWEGRHEADGRHLTATRNAADLLGASGDVGSIQPGRYADIIADPLQEVTALESVSFVMKGGSVVRSAGQPMS